MNGRLQYANDFEPVRESFGEILIILWRWRLDLSFCEAVTDVEMGTSRFEEMFIKGKYFGGNSSWGMHYIIWKKS